MKKPNPVNRIYPTQSGPLSDFHAWAAHKVTLDRLYDLHDAFNQFKHEIVTKSNVGQQQEAGGPSNTMITGIPVKAVAPANGQTIRYNSATGQFEFAV